MLLLIPIWLALFGVLVGWGLLVLWALRRLGGRAFRGGLTMFQTMWLGYAGLLGFIQLCSLGLPIDRLVLVAGCAPAIAGFVLHRRSVARRLRSLRLRPRVVAVVAVATLVAWLVIAYEACGLVTHRETGLYDLQVVKWNATYSAVPGLANLHARFGYNNSNLLFAAFVDAFWEGVAVHAMNGFLMAAALGHWFSEIFAARTPRGRLRQVYCLFTLPLLLSHVWSTQVASLGTDLPLTIFAFVLGLEVLSLQRARLLPLAFIVALGAVVATTKLNGVALGVVAWGLAIYHVRRDVSWRVRLVLFGLPIAIMLGWLSRGAILSGWLVFPVWGKLPLAWAVRSKAAASHLREIESSSRLAGRGPELVFGHGVMHWLTPWVDNFRETRECVLLAISTAMLAWRGAHGPAESPARRAGEWAAIGGCILGLIVWFVGAPDVRFGAFLFWMLPAILFAPMVANAMRDARTRALILALSIVATGWAGGFAARVASVAPDFLWGRPPDPQVPATVRMPTGPGTEVLVPKGSDSCWDAELPCTSAPRTQTLREPSSFGDGFYPGPP